MAKLYYRSMAEANGKPRVGRSARSLGVRPGTDIDIGRVPRDWLDKQGYLRPEAERSPSGEPVTIAIRNTKGMSISLSIESLPAFRRPETFGGVGKDPIWQIEDSKIIGDIEAVQDSPTHVSVLPRTTMLLERYEAALARTQTAWERVG